MKMILKSTRNYLLLFGVASAFAEQTVRNSTNIPSNVHGTYQIGPYYSFPEAIYPCSDDCEKGDFFQLYMPIEDTSYNCDAIDNPSLQDWTGTDVCADDANATSNCNCADGFCGGPTDERGIAVYVPAAYKENPEDEIAVLVMQDGILPSWMPINSTYFDDFSYFEAVTNVMDRMNKDLPPFVLVGVALAGITLAGSGIFSKPPCNDGTGSERANEYDTVSDTYAKFISDEVLPFITNQSKFTEKYPNLKFTNDPAGRGAIGTSNGGNAAIKMSFFTPELFGISIGYNAAILNQYDGTITSNDKYPLGSGELWQPQGMELINNTDKQPIRIFHSACNRDFGTENGCIRTGPNPDDKLNALNASFWYDVGVGDYGGFDFLVANNVTEELLVSKGYDTRYAYGLDCCHSDDYMFLQDIPNTLVWAFDNWKQKLQHQANNESTPPSESTSAASSSSSLVVNVSSYYATTTTTIFVFVLYLLAF